MSISSVNRNSICPCGSGKKYKHCCGIISHADQKYVPDAKSDERHTKILYAALAAQQKGDFDWAEKLYLDALTQWPKDVDALHMLGVVYFSKGDLHKAEEYLLSALEIAGKPVPVIEHNLTLVKEADSAIYETDVINSFLSAELALRKMGIDVYGADTNCAHENTARLIAFYLPQYHRIPENDVWWGDGFTEWANVKRAKPNFGNHYQPHEPSELGYYDLSDTHVMETQAALAREYGISGFCFYYYWFNGKRLLEMPLEQMLASGKPDFPYCLCWANENWSRNWDGGNREILMEQHYSTDDDREFILGLLPYFRDPRYIRIGNRPLLVIYRINLLPDSKQTIKIWHDICSENGVEPPYIVMANTFQYNESPYAYGADATSDFPPHGVTADVTLRKGLEKVATDYDGKLVDYINAIARFLKKAVNNHTHFPGIIPSWDNTARRQYDGLCIQGSSPHAFEVWLRELIYRARRLLPETERIIFINAWNEWAEGCHLEPDKRYGRAWLEACRRARLMPERYQGILGTAGSMPISASTGYTLNFTINDIQLVDNKQPAEHLMGVLEQEEIIFDGEEKIPQSPLLWQESLPASIITAHQSELVSPATKIVSVSDVCLYGPGWLSRDNEVLFSNELNPEYCRIWYASNRVGNQMNLNLGKLRRRHYNHGWHVTNFNCGVYGHWLLETMPKLLVIKEYLARHPEMNGMPIFIPAILPKFVFSYTQYVLPHVPIVTYNPNCEYITADRIYSSNLGNEHIYDSWSSRRIDEIPCPHNIRQPERIYISRKTRSLYRELSNSTELEDISRQAGLAIVYPEEHSFPEQIAIFRSARLIVGEYGSALHNAIFSAPGATIIACNWINDLQSRIARIRKHSIGYQLATTGKLLTHAEDKGVTQYSIDPCVFRRNLLDVIGMP